MALGDSSLTGPGLLHPEQNWLRQALGRLDGSPTIELVSLAVGGSRVADISAQLDRCIEACPHLVVLAVGANDAIHGTPTGQFSDRLRAVLVELGRSVPVVAVTNIGDLGNIARVGRPLTAVLRRRSLRLCRVVEKVVASQEHAVLIDITSSNVSFRDRSVYAADLFHPSERGHSIWADAATNDLQRAVDGWPTLCRRPGLGPARWAQCAREPMGAKRHVVATSVRATCGAVPTEFSSSADTDMNRLEAACTSSEYGASSRRVPWSSLSE